MDQKQWEQVEAHFAEVAELTPESQEAYLSRLGARAPSLRSELESLLRAHREGATFLEHEPDRIGPYRVIEEIGSGGMGKVYRAERDDGQFQQQVAIKLVRPLGPAPLFRRLKTERQILANLAHPYIARLLDGGITRTGLPYLVMELIDGVPLTDYCQGKSRKAVLRLFRQICSAVNYAHQNLVVHCDLKPANIFVTREGIPKLLDFGIARILAPASGSVTIQPAMTPDYASPEQVRGEQVTTASDVYSLGVLLQELLTGKRPYNLAGKAPFEIIRILNEQPLEKPGTGSEDLDAIITKALNKDPLVRYSSADAIAADIARHLEQRPVEARRRAPWYVLRKFVSRHRLPVGAAAAAVLVVAVAVAAIVRQSRIAQHRFEVVRHLASTTIFQIHDSVASLPGSTASRKLIVANALEALDRLAADAAQDEALKLELAEAYVRLGNVQGNHSQANLGDGEAALASYGKARSLLEDILNSGRSHEAAARSLIRLNLTASSLLGFRRRTDEAIKLASDSVTMAEDFRKRYPGEQAERLLASAHSILAEVTPDNLEARTKALAIFDELLERQPGDLDRQRNVALTSRYIAGILVRKGLADQALPHMLRAEALDNARAEADPGNRQAQLDLSFDYSVIGDYQLDRGRLDLALEQYRKALQIRRKLVESDPSDVLARGRVSYMHTRVGLTLHRMRRHEEAMQAYQESVRLTESLAATDPTNPLYQASLASAHLRIASAALDSGRAQAGCSAVRVALGMYRQLGAAGKLDDDERDDLTQAELLSRKCPPPLG